MKTWVTTVEVQWHGDRPLSYHFHRTGYRPNSYGHINREVRYPARYKSGEFNMHRYKRLEAALVNHTCAVAADAVLIYQTRKEFGNE